MKKTIDGGVILSNRELYYIADALREIINFETSDVTEKDGVWLHALWLTPETCYHIANLLETNGLKSPQYEDAIASLRKACNI